MKEVSQPIHDQVHKHLCNQQREHDHVHDCVGGPHDHGDGDHGCGGGGPHPLALHSTISEYDLVLARCHSF